MNYPCTLVALLALAALACSSPGQPPVSASTGSATPAEAGAESPAAPQAPAPTAPAAAPAPAEAAPAAAQLAARLAGAAKGRIAVVDVDRAVASSSAGQQTRQKVAALTDDKQKVLVEQQQELQRRAGDFEKQKAQLAPDAAQAQALALERLQSSLTRSIEEARQDITLAERELLGPVVARMQAVLREIGQETGVWLILATSESGLIFYDNVVDLTDVVIERMNRPE